MAAVAVMVLNKLVTVCLTMAEDVLWQKPRRCNKVKPNFSAFVVKIPDDENSSGLSTFFNNLE